MTDDTTSQTRQKTPSLEFRIPISPNDTDMRMVRHFLESIRVYGGPIARSAHCVLSIGAAQDEPSFDMAEAYPWTKEYSISFRWLNQDIFEKWTYDATGFDRFWVASDADIVALIDSDLLVTGDFDPIIRQAHESQTMLGFISHVSPFGFEDRDPFLTDQELWDMVFAAGGLQTPSLDFEYTAWGVDWSEYGRKIASRDENFRRCPPYFNYGFIVGPREYFDQMGETFVADLEAVHRALPSIYSSQITNCLGFARHNIPCATIPINYNFPLNKPGGDVLMQVNPGLNGPDGNTEVKIFHYIGCRKHFTTAQRVRNLVEETSIQQGSWAVFLQKLGLVTERIGEK